MDEIAIAVSPAAPTFENEALHALTVAEAEIVKAAAARIFPTTDTPGASEAGVVHYIDRLLSQAYPRQLAAYRKGCVALNRQAQRKFNRGFVALSAEEQDAVLADFEKGRVTGSSSASDFFARLRQHTMEGVLGEPAYGGNRNLVGWRLVGFPGQQFGYADPYINRLIDLEPVAHDGPVPAPEAAHDFKR